MGYEVGMGPANPQLTFKINNTAFHKTILCIKLKTFSISRQKLLVVGSNAKIATIFYVAHSCGTKFHM